MIKNLRILVFLVVMLYHWVCGFQCSIKTYRENKFAQALVIHFHMHYHAAQKWYMLSLSFLLTVCRSVNLLGSTYA
jgi:hypothetical protein